MKKKIFSFAFSLLHLMDILWGFCLWIETGYISANWSSICHLMPAGYPRKQWLSVSGFCRKCIIFEPLHWIPVHTRQQSESLESDFDSWNTLSYKLLDMLRLLGISTNIAWCRMFCVLWICLGRGIIASMLTQLAMKYEDEMNDTKIHMPETLVNDNLAINGLANLSLIALVSLVRQHIRQWQGPILSLKFLGCNVLGLFHSSP